MEILRTIAIYTELKGLPFIVIGGHAVNAYGISRQTGDIDLLIPRVDHGKWQELLIRLNYKENQSDDIFARFSHPILGNWPIDLMLVDSDTFDNLYKESKQMTIGVADVNVVSLKHLVILKIHALKYYHEHRYVKDYNDLLQLLKSPKTQIDTKILNELCLQYSDEKLYNKLKTDLSW